MKISVIADIHGNLEAFEQVLIHIDKDASEKIFSLGDNIGYGPDPEAVMKLINENSIESVLGNHELAIKDKRYIKWFNPTAREAVKFTIKELSESSVNLIKTFKKSIVYKNMRFVHGAPPESATLYLFQLTDDFLIKKMSKMDEMICFAGHTHDLELICYDGKEVERRALKEENVTLSTDCKYIVNVGSVGQPRDGDKKAKFVIYDSDSHVLEIRYVTYNARKTAEKIVNSGLPKQFAKRLL